MPAELDFNAIYGFIYGQLQGVLGWVAKLFGGFADLALAPVYAANGASAVASAADDVKTNVESIIALIG